MGNDGDWGDAGRKGAASDRVARRTRNRRQRPAMLRDGPASPDLVGVLDGTATEVSGDVAGPPAEYKSWCNNGPGG